MNYLMGRYGVAESAGMPVRATVSFDVLLPHPHGSIDSVTSTHA